MDEDVARHLARNLRELRAVREMTQARLAERSGVPRATVATLEGGSSNPTLSVLLGLSRALGVTIEELIGPPRDTGRHVAAADLPVRSHRGVQVREVLPAKVPGLGFERMHFDRDAVLQGVPHTRGTREFLTCEHGRIQLVVAGKCWVLEPGDVVAFRGDHRHSYRNVGEGDAVAFSVVALVP